MLKSKKLDEAIYTFQKRHNLTEEQQDLLSKADMALLQEQEEEAEAYLLELVALDEVSVTKAKTRKK